MVYTEFLLNIKYYGSLDRKRKYLSDRQPCTEKNYKEILNDNTEALESLDIWLALYLIQREIIWKQYNFKSCHLRTRANT